MTTTDSPQMFASDFLLRGEGSQEYYDSLHKRHFSPQTATGSTFTTENFYLADLIMLTISQRGDLLGDDRDLFPASPPGTFKEGSRYLKVATPGLSGATLSQSLPPDATLTVAEGKPGVAPDLIAPSVPLVLVDYATLIVSEQDGRVVVITAHPGPPMPPASSWRETLRPGQTVLASEVPPGETVLLAPKAPSKAKKRTSSMPLVGPSSPRAARL